METPGFCFLPEMLFAEVAGASGSSASPALIGSRDAIAIPDGCSYLELAREGNVALASDRKPRTHPGVVALEQLRLRNRRVLLMECPPGLRVRLPVRLNGQPVPRIAPLRLGDELRVGDALRLHLSLYVDPTPVRAARPQIGQDCPICRTAVTDDQHVVPCPICGEALHADPSQGEAADALDCARLASDCPTCGEPIRTRAGFVSLPEA